MGADVRQFIRGASLSILEGNYVQSTLKGLRVSFKIEKSITSDPNSSEIKIYNLSDSTIEKLLKKDSSISLSVGYEDSFKKIFDGNDVTIETGFEGANKYTIIKSGDGKKQLSETKINEKIPEASDISSIVTTLVGKLKDVAFSGVEKIKLVGLGQVMSGGVLNGSVKDILDSILSPQKISYSIQNGELKISTNREIPTSSYVISAKSGLIGTPQKTKEGVKFKILLNPDIAPHTYVMIQTKSINGVYRVTNLVHEGDTHGQDWFTEFEANTI